MNILFQALVIFALVLPGVLARSSYFRGGWNYPLGRLGSVSDEVPRALVLAGLLNWLWYLLVSLAIRFRIPGALPIDLDALVCWMSNNFGPDQGRYRGAVAALTRSPTRVFFYFAGLYAVAWSGGYLIHGLVRKRRWDRTSRFWRFDNDWHYLLRGEVLEFPDQAYNRNSGGEAAGAARSPEATIVAAIVDAKDASLLYIGFLVDFHFDAAGNLDRLLLEGTQRRPLHQDASTRAGDASYFDGSRFYRVRGRYFILRTSEIKTLNVDYLKSEDLDRMRSMEKRTGEPTPSAERRRRTRPGPFGDGTERGSGPGETTDEPS